MSNGKYLDALIESGITLAEKVGARAIVVMTPVEPDAISTDLPVVIIGSSFFRQGNRIFLPLSPALGLNNVLNIITAYLLDNEFISEGEGFVYITTDSVGIKEAQKGGILKKAFFTSHQSVFQSLLDIVIELATEGREGKPVGAIFVLGDTRNVQRHSHQMVPNPFKGHNLNVLEKRAKEVIKEFAFLDGAFLIAKNGRVMAAGRYLDVDAKKLGVEVPQGLGSRHIAAAGITKITKAIAITLSESGVIRIFRDGEMILEYNPRIVY